MDSSSAKSSKINRQLEYEKFIGKYEDNRRKSKTKNIKGARMMMKKKKRTIEILNIKTER